MRFRVRGRVQGVFYRAATEVRARRLGVNGWVRNLADGDVEVLACGDAAVLADLETWLWQGPPHARVTAVTRAPADEPEPQGFQVIR